MKKRSGNFLAIVAIIIGVLVLGAFIGFGLFGKGPGNGPGDGKGTTKSEEPSNKKPVENVEEKKTARILVEKNVGFKIEESLFKTVEDVASYLPSIASLTIEIDFKKASAGQRQDLLNVFREKKIKYSQVE